MVKEFGLRWYLLAGEAYQVLNDAKRRAEYDKYGVSATRNMNFIDPALFFMMLFGSEQLDSYIGTPEPRHLRNKNQTPHLRVGENVSFIVRMKCHFRASFWWSSSWGVGVPQSLAVWCFLYYREA